MISSEVLGRPVPEGTATYSLIFLALERAFRQSNSGEFLQASSDSDKTTIYVVVKEVFT